MMFGTLVLHLFNIASLAASCDFAHITAFSNAAPVTVPATTTSTLPPPILALPTFLLSPLTFSSSAPRPLNTAASAVVVGVALRPLRDRLTRRDAEYTSIAHRFVAREDEVELLTAEVHSLRSERQPATILVLT